MCKFVIRIICTRCVQITSSPYLFFFLGGGRESKANKTRECSRKLTPARRHDAREKGKINVGGKISRLHACFTGFTLLRGKKELLVGFGTVKFALFLCGFLTVRDKRTTLPDMD